jgi:uncharacterized repeat protein (TIGR03803 family)
MKPQELPRTRPLTTLALILLIATTGFSVTPKEAVLYHFKGDSDGAYPSASLVEDSAHNLYGTTVDGGASDFGTVFELSPPGTAWAETVLYSFTGGNDGANPYSDVIFDKAGNLYGTTYLGGGSYDSGVVFEISFDTWTETVLYDFAAGNAGANPWARLLIDKAGNLYGTTTVGGDDYGSAFELSPPAVRGDT